MGLQSGWQSKIFPIDLPKFWAIESRAANLSGTAPRDGKTLANYALLLMLGFEIKHYFADYALQFQWMIGGKGNFARIGGYAHAGVHVLGTLAVFALLGVAAGLAAALIVFEFVVHYLLDFSKAHFGDHISAAEQPRMFWALNGLDQFFHHLTYVALAYLVVQFT